MGWTSYHAKYYKSNGEIDRKAECDAYFLESLNSGYYKVLKSAVVGSVYYAAVQSLKRYSDKRDADGNRTEEDIPEGERKTWAAVILTRLDSRDYFNFTYKEMSEDCGPCENKCPVSILKLLSETDDEFALEWRKRCWKYHESRKSPMNLSNLPVGASISFNDSSGKEQVYVKQPAAYQFKRSFWYSPASDKYIPQKYIPANYTILSQGEGGKY